MQHRFSIDLPLRNDWGNVDLVRTSILNCFTVVFTDVDGCRSVAMVVGELLENAIKYGAWNGEDRAFHLRVTGEAHKATVIVQNPIDGESGAGDLVATIAWIKKFPTAEEAYRTRLLEVAAAPRSLERSQLGLARVAYEGNCDLCAEVGDGSVRVTAELAY